MPNRNKDQDVYAEVMQPENLPLGSGTPLSGLMDYNTGAAVAGMDPMAQLGQNLGVEQFQMPVTPPVNELDLSQDPNFAPLPADPSPTKADQLAAAKVILGTHDQPEQLPTVDRVVGKTSTSTSSQDQSQESLDAVADLEQAKADSKAASEMEAQAAADQLAVESKISQEDNNVISSIEGARAAVQTENQMKFQAAIQDIDDKVAELSNFKPETFWGSKSTADKITAALSVGLGAYGQALLGSGSNIGQVLLERNMNEFDRNQQMEYNNKLKTIQNMKGSLDMKKQLADDAEKTFDAKKLAARAQVQSANAKALAMAKTPGVKAGIMQRQAKMDADIAGKQAEIASKYEARTTTVDEKDVIQRVAQTPGIGKDGKPLKLTEGEAKARVALADVASANQALKGVDVNKVIHDPAYQTFLSSANNERNFRSVPIVGGALKGIGDALSGTNEQYLAKQNPELAKINAAMAAWTRGVIRYKSGAAIAVQEEADERNQYWPALGDTEESLKDKAKARAEIEKAMRQAGAL